RPEEPNTCGGACARPTGHYPGNTQRPRLRGGLQAACPARGRGAYRRPLCISQHQRDFGAGCALQDTDDLPPSRLRRGGRPDELRRRLRRHLSPSRRLHPPDSCGRQAGGPSRHACDKIRTGQQPPDRPSPWPRNLTPPARDRRRGDRVMKRRAFITLLGGAAASPLAARAQQAAKRPIIGFLGGNASNWTTWTAAFVKRLSELGWIEDRTITIAYRWSE